VYYENAKSGVDQLVQLSHGYTELSQDGTYPEIGLSAVLCGERRAEIECKFETRSCRLGYD
jgi:hypothetical protein